MNFKFLVLVLALLLFSGVVILPVSAQDYTGSSFIVRDPVFNLAGGQSTSTNFQLFSSGGELLSGQSSVGSFLQRAGFLYFPVATSPTLSATAGENQVDLSWTASTATLANITSYQLGVSTTSGGSYTYEDVGNVLSYSKTGLSGGTTYYFVVRPLAGTLALATSGEVSSTPTGSSTTSSGGGSSSVLSAEIIFKGRSYPNSRIVFLKDGLYHSETRADSVGNFSKEISGLAPRNYIFGLYARDKNGIDSSIVNFTIPAGRARPLEFSGILMPPTIFLDKTQVKRGSSLTISGQSIAGANLFATIASANLIVQDRAATVAGGNGDFNISYDTSFLNYGKYLVSSRSEVGAGLVSSDSKIMEFLVGLQDVTRPPAENFFQIGDLNFDGKVDIVDFSILIYWFEKVNPPALVDLSADGQVDLVDFSIMAYYWTG